MQIQSIEQETIFEYITRINITARISCVASMFSLLYLYGNIILNPINVKRSL